MKNNINKVLYITMISEKIIIQSKLKDNDNTSRAYRLKFLPKVFTHDHVF
eukprot:UN04223